MKNKLSLNDRKLISKSFLPDVDFGRECWTNGELPEDFNYHFSETPFKSKRERGHYHSYFYINNPDGSVRWIFSSDSKFPGFLDLYNASGFKARLLILLCRILFLVKLQSLITSGRFYFFSRKLSLQEAWKTKMDFDSFSVFTGTIGPNRKILFALHKNEKTIGFVKHPINYESLCLVSTENRVLKAMEDKTFSNMFLPRSKYLGSGDIFINNIRNSQIRSTNTFTNKHALALKDLYTLNRRELSLKDSILYKDIRVLMAGFYSESEVPFHSELCMKIKSLFESLDAEQNISMAWAHMDFTPWNLFVPSDDSKLGIIDWELSKPGIPMLFDLFHYVFQSQILVERNNYKGIYQMIEETISQNLILKSLIEANHIDVKFHFRLYLIHNISYYLNIYQKQEKLHVQVNWLTAVWNEALSTELKLIDNKSHREIFIADLFQFMQGKKYAWLHTCNTSTKKIDPRSDLDFVISKSARNDVMEFCDSHVLIARYKSFRKSFMTTSELFFSDGSFLSLDLIRRLVRKNLVFMDANQIIENAVYNSEGISVPRMQDDFSYLISFYALNQSTIPEKYQDYYKNILDVKQDLLREITYSKFGLYAANIEQMFQALSNNSLSIKRQVSKLKVNRGIRLFMNSFNYLIDTVRSLFFRKGLVITFSGVDGAGKSTLIADVALRLEKYYRKKVIVLRHRPSLLPILSAFRYGKKEAENRAAKTLPHQGKNTAVLSSVLRFSYYYIDYLFGQIYINIRYVSRGYVVLYDRYYFDFINDSRRSNISISKKVVKQLYRLVYKPKYNFFFYASPDIIRERKKELSASEISRLTKNYFSMFKRFEEKYKNSNYQCIENIDREETLEKVFSQVQHSL